MLVYYPPVDTQSFQSLFCERFNCPPSQYEEQAVRECLYRHARLLAPVLLRLRPDFFAEDAKFLRYLGQATSLNEAQADVADFKEHDCARSSFWRNQLKIRVSGRKATKLAYDLLGRARQTARKAR